MAVSTTKMLTVFCYDISNDAIRYRVSKILEESAVRVQRSVFESWLDCDAAETIANQIAPELKTGDSLRVYAVGFNGIRRTKVYGCGVLSRPGSFIMV